MIATHAHQEGFRGKLAVELDDRYFKFIATRMYQAASPDYVFCMGDIFSHYMLKPAEFQRRHARYSSIFGTSVPLFNLSGNHDLGYAIHVSQLTFACHSRHRRVNHSLIAGRKCLDQ